MPPLAPEFVAAIVPTYNDLKYLPQAIDSILSQTTPPGELIIADDCSSDGTPTYVKGLISCHKGAPRITYLQLVGRSGPDGARNAAIAVANADWIAACDSDDVWLADKLERQIAFINEWRDGRQIVALGTCGLNINEKGKVLSPFDYGIATEADFDRQRRRQGILWLAQSSVIFDKSVYSRVGGYRSDYRGVEDADLWSRMADHGVILNMPERLTCYRKRAGSIQQSMFWTQQENLRRISENQLRRASGAREIGVLEFSRQLQAERFAVRLRRRRHDMAKYYYRRGSVRVVNHQVLRGLADLLMSAALDMRRVFNGVAAMARNLGRSPFHRSILG
jgi:glycosyltransferase involved in cell wall biosynthesis